MYQVSNLGNVKSLDRSYINSLGRKYFIDGRILKNYLDSRGYMSRLLSKKSKHKIYKVHQLVAISFLNHKPKETNLVVDHINNIKTDNRLENLQIITSRENVSRTKRGSSKYTGVSFDKKCNKWRARIHINHKDISLGYFTNELDAYNAYQTALSKASV